MCLLNALVLTLLALIRKHLEGFLSHRFRGATPRMSVYVGLWMGLRVCIFNKFPDEAYAAGP